MEEIIISNFPECKRLMTDNEASFVTLAPVHRSKANEQIERTLLVT